MAIYVVGCNHGIQVHPDGVWSADDPPEMQEQRKYFAALLEDIIRQKKIEFIGEESGGGEETSAEHLADKYKIQPPRNINTTNADLERMKIPNAYMTEAYSNEQKEHWHHQREQFMLARVREYRGSAENLLIVCGFDHFDRLSGLLQQEGEVQQINYRKCKWYRKGVFSGDG